MASSDYLNVVWFAVLPYVAIFSFFLVSIERYRKRSFTYSSLSSQFLENQEHFWALVPFHYGILVVLGGHILAFLLPAQILWWNSRPLRLYLTEITGLVFALLALIGLAAAIVRRVARSDLRRVTSVGDWVLLALLLVQIGSGIGVALTYPWGSSWFAAVAAPYLWSLVKLSPEVNYVAALPVMVKLHIVTAYLLIGFFPFTRLVHVLVAPVPYLWRKPQLVRWYGRLPAARSTR